MSTSKLAHIAEVFDTACTAVVIATPFGFAAAGYSATGHIGVPFVLLFLAWCGYVVGRKQSTSRWQKSFDERLVRIVEHELKVRPSPVVAKMLEDLKKDPP